MTEKEMNSYRFTSGEEPTDEMLAQLMKEVAQEASRRQTQATDAYFAEMKRQIESKKIKWADRINHAING